MLAGKGSGCSHYNTGPGGILEKEKANKCTSLCVLWGWQSCFRQDRVKGQLSKFNISIYFFGLTFFKEVTYSPSMPKI